MLTTVPPMLAYQRDSARVENRGPSIDDHRAAVDECESGALGDGPHRGPAGRTVRVGEVHVDRAAVVERLVPARRTVDELVRQHERAGAEVGAKPADRAGREDLAYADLAQRPEVRPVRNPVRRKTVIAAVAGQERDTAATDLGDRDRVRRRPVRRVDDVLRRPVEQRVEPRSTDDADIGQCRHAQTLTGGWTQAMVRGMVVTVDRIASG